MIGHTVSIESASDRLIRCVCQC